MKATEWMDDQTCRIDPNWTTDDAPSTDIRDQLAAICGACPVVSACASYALDNRSEAGMYAGVWLPQSGATRMRADRGYNAGWLEARAALARKIKALAS